jgi:hypothetical protein
MGVAVLARAGDEVSVARFTLHSHQLAKLDRFVAQARRHATRSRGKFSGVTIEIDPAGAVTVHAANLEPLVL